MEGIQVYFLHFRVFTNVGVDVGLVGCVMSLSVNSKEADKEFNLMFPGSDDILSGSGIGRCLAKHKILFLWLFI